MLEMKGVKALVLGLSRQTPPLKVAVVRFLSMAVQMKVVKLLLSGW